MKFVCLVYDDEQEWERMPKARSDALMEQYFALTGELEQSGQLLGGEALQSVQSAVTVRVREGRMATTAGPFAETREQLGGYFLIEAADLDEAVRIASRIPSAGVGCVEVRPVMTFDAP